MARAKLSISQLQTQILTGTGPQVVTFGGGPKTSGHYAAWDSGGNIIASASGATHAEALTDGLGNLVFANGDLIYVLGVPG